jgi:D-arabinose 1-dehydrogenase-like Zn-dependent alcohol dehydrogenase
MAKMRAVQVSRPKAPLEVVQRDIPEPGAGTVRIKVEACGICHSDSATVEGLLPGIEYPRIPGHEVMGTIDAVGPGVAGFRLGQRVGVGWNAGYDGRCDACRRGYPVACRLNLATGVSSDGGYAEYMVARTEAVASLPDGMAMDCAPLMDAGVTTFNALRNSGARPGDLVAVLGLGGLGHLGVQYAAKMGFLTVAIARGKDKEPLAKKLGASHYVDSNARDPAADLAKLGGASVILSTITSAKAVGATLGGLGLGGKLVVVGLPAEPIEVSSFVLAFGLRSLSGSLAGTAVDAQDTLAFSQRTDVRPMTEAFPLARAAEAYERMMSGNMRFRGVLTMAP